MENNAAFFVDRLNKLSHFWSKNAFQRPAFRRHDVDFDIVAAQSARNFKSNKACAQDDCAARASCTLDDGAAVSKRTKRMYAGLLASWNPETNRLSSSCEQQPIVSNLLAIG